MLLLIKVTSVCKYDSIFLLCAGLLSLSILFITIYLFIMFFVCCRNIRHYSILFQIEFYNCMSDILFVFPCSCCTSICIFLCIIKMIVCKHLFYLLKNRSQTFLLNMQKDKRRHKKVK